MTPYLAAVSEDIDALAALQPGVAIALIRHSGTKAAIDGDALPHVVIDGVPMAADELVAGMLGVVILSQAARGAVSAFCAAMVARFGTPAPAVIDLTGINPAGDGAARLVALQQAMIAGLLHDRQDRARRSVALMQDLAQMRLTYARMQDSFSLLEDHLYRHALAERQQTLALDPPEGAGSVLLRAGLVLQQRLPRGSRGLCDVAVLIADPGGDEALPMANGVLRISLATLEDDETHALWQIPAAQLQPGWMRLSLHSALPAEAQTAILRLEWVGEGAVALDQALRHPDPRFQAVVRPLDAKTPTPQDTGRMLALRLWSFVPGCAAPAPSDGIFPGGRLGERPVRRLMISAETLATAVNLRPANQPYLYLPDSRSLLLHVSPEGPSVGVLAAAVPAQTSRISAKIMTRAAGASPIEYAFAIAPAAGEPVPGSELPAFAAGHQTEWHRLPPMTEGEIHLVLPKAVAEAHDLYMLTRLPEGIEDASWGWATFSAFRLIL